MDLFKYQLELARIDSAKYVKDLRELVYYYYDLDTRYNSIANNFNYEASNWFKYKLYAKAYNAYYAKSKAQLPDKFKSSLISRQKRVLDASVGGSSPINYEQLLDLFEFDIHVESPAWSETGLLTFCNIVGTNSLPFTLHINTYMNHLSTTTYFNNLNVPYELSILAWMKVNGVPESFTVADIYRKQYTYINTEANHAAVLAERANLVLALESMDQLTGGEVYE